MGGRGSTSLVFTNEKTGGGLTNIGGAADRRADIQTMFVSELGFEEVSGTNRIPTATLGSYGIVLNELEREYGAIAASEGVVFTTANSRDAATGTLAAIYYNDSQPNNQFMVINSSKLSSTKQALKVQSESESTGWWPSTNGKITRRNGQIITHEYGHMLSNALAAQSGMTGSSFSLKAAQEITSIARSKYGASSSSPSTYGGTNAAELFAESFASYRSGNPNAYGKAMGDWLQSNKLRRR